MSTAVMRFGRWKGKPVDEVPTDYLQWLLRECDLRDDFVEEVQAQLDAREGKGIPRGPINVEGVE